MAMRRLSIAWLAAALSTASQAGHDPYHPPVPAKVPAAPAWQALTLGAAAAYPFPVYANRALDAGSLHEIRRLVIVVHGVKRDAAGAYLAAQALLTANPARRDDTLIVAPKFPSAVDIGFGAMPAWRRNSWEDGEPSLQARGRPTPIGSMQVLDDLLHALTDPQRLPSLQHVVLAGHSAGGQLVQRYAVLNHAEPALRRQGLTLQYVVANPSSYLYLSADRPRTDGKGFAPYERGICPTYNQYKYGLDALPAYLPAVDRSRLAARYMARHVVYLLGGADNNPEHQFLDKSCGAEAQGATRWARGLGFWRQEQWRASRQPAWPAQRHRAEEVVDVGHVVASMYASTCGARALLGSDSMPLPDGAPCRPIPAR